MCKRGDGEGGGGGGGSSSSGNNSCSSLSLVRPSQRSTWLASLYYIIYEHRTQLGRIVVRYNIEYVNKALSSWSFSTGHRQIWIPKDRPQNLSIEKPANVWVRDREDMFDGSASLPAVQGTVRYFQVHWDHGMGLSDASS